jgi:hypothetical protein
MWCRTVMRLSNDNSLCSVADPHHVDANPDPTFHFDEGFGSGSGAYSTFHFDLDPDLTVASK